MRDNYIFKSIAEYSVPYSIRNAHLRISHCGLEGSNRCASCQIDCDELVQVHRVHRAYLKILDIYKYVIARIRRLGQNARDLHVDLCF